MTRGGPGLNLSSGDEAFEAGFTHGYQIATEARPPSERVPAWHHEPSWVVAIRVEAPEATAVIEAAARQEMINAVEALSPVVGETGEVVWGETLRVMRALQHGPATRTVEAATEAGG